MRDTGPLLRPPGRHSHDDKKPRATVNTEWAIAQLEEFLRLTDSRNGSRDGIISTRSYALHPREQILSQWVVVEKILDAVHPGWRNQHSMRANYEFGQRRDAVTHARAVIQRDEELRGGLGPLGPSLLAEDLHPWIWEPASGLWRDSHYRAAVQTASSALEARLQDFVGRFDITGRDLVLQIFSDDEPAEGRPRIRAPGRTNEESTRSLQRGMRALGEACFAIARNLSSHSVSEISEREALEQLAMLSLFARILNTCTVVTGEGSLS
jgi:hypothetical protein